MIVTISGKLIPKVTTRFCLFCKKIKLKTKVILTVDNFSIYNKKNIKNKNYYCRLFLLLVLFSKVNLINFKTKLNNINLIF